MSAEARWWLLRHAPVPAPAGRIVGALDVPCDTSDAAPFLWWAARIPAGCVLVESGLMRCRQTSGALEAAGLALPPPLVEPDLAEQDFGRWQGRSWAELEAAADEDLPAFWHAPATACPPGGESFAQVMARVARRMAALSDRLQGRDVLAVLHAGSIRAALALALDLSPQAALRLSVAPLSMTRIDRVAGSWRVDQVNGVAG